MIAVDASLALKLVLDEHDSLKARALWQIWTGQSELLIAPSLFRVETFSTLRRHVHGRKVSQEDGELGFSVLDGLTVEIREPAELYRVAWRLAERFNRPTVYDCCYLALATIFGCEFWTADQKLANAVSNQIPGINVLNS